MASIYQLLTYAMTAALNITLDTLFASLMANICLQLDILFGNSKHIFENSLKSVKINGREKINQSASGALAKEMEKGLLECVDHHRLIIKFVY